MNADCAHLSEQPGLLGCSLFMRQKAARGYTLQKGPMVRMCQSIYKPACLVGAFIKKTAAGNNPWLSECFLVEMMGFEPTASALRTLRSPS
jgi:hypothetical protein